MIVKPIQFLGTCSNCHEPPEDGAVAVSGCGDAKDEFDGADWLCLKCALRFAKRILKARRVVREKVSAGYAFRNGKWQKPSGA